VSWIKKRKKVLIIFIIVVIIIPFLFHFFIFENSFPSNVSNDGWAGFFGGYIGAIIGAISTIIAISIEIEHNKLEKQKDEIASVRPYLYINKLFPSNISKKCTITLTIQNLGIQAACSIRIFEHNQDLPKPVVIYDSRFAIASNQKIELELEMDFNNTEYYYFEYYDIKDNLYQQEFRAVLKNFTDYKEPDHFIMFEPQMIQTKKERKEKLDNMRVR